YLSSMAINATYCIRLSTRTCSSRQDFEHGYNDFYALSQKPGHSGCAADGNCKDARQEAAAWSVCCRLAGWAASAYRAGCARTGSWWAYFGTRQLGLNWFRLAVAA